MLNETDKTLVALGLAAGLVGLGLAFYAHVRIKKIEDKLKVMPQSGKVTEK